MWWVILAIGWIVLVVSFFPSAKNKEEKRIEEEREKARKYAERHDQRASRLFELKEKQKKGDFEITMTVSDGNDYDYSIKGINFCGLDDSMLGDFFGTARALKSNKYDPYAIGVYIGSKRVGYLPAGNKVLHARLMSCGGSDVEGYIAKGEGEDGREFYYGKVKLLEI